MKQGTYELKYCERCGSLGTRRAQSSDTYCESCAQILTQAFLPVIERRPHARRGGKNTQPPPPRKGQGDLSCGRWQ